MTKGRLEAFSDGVIAIIITITILEIGLPEGNDMRALIAILPLVACYLISFIMVGTNWANHHHLLQVAGSQNIVGKPSLPLRPVLPACSNRLGRQILICNASGQSILLTESCRYFELCSAPEAHYQRT